ncbi:MAG: Holliday junction branch migration protein RuvA [Candidatus Nanopelagicales bacterium]|nr:Holliday junction branch migration protein RuvA [Candidatus Nanopelagicales bacterium]
MIAFIRGSVQAVGPDTVVVDLGGVGLQATCTAPTALALRVGERVELLTSLVVREDGWTLYAFATAEERTIFEQVQTVTGIGPRIALAVLGTMAPDELRAAVATDDLTALVRIPGIGRKGAQRLVLELKDRLGAPSGGVASRALPVDARWQSSVAAGLTSLGWSAREAEAAVDAIAPLAVDAGDAPDIGMLLKAALQTLDRA